MTRALIARNGGIQRSFAGAVLPRTGSAGQLLAQYSVRLGGALLQHRAEIAERAWRIEAEVASRVKSEFIANVSHELRTPLNSIIGFSKIIKDSGSAPLEPGQIAEYSNFIFDSANGLLDVVNDIITISKLQSGKLEMQIEQTDADELVRSCAHWATQQIKGTRTKFFHSADAGLAPVDADPGQLKTVIIRLLRNAIAFTPEDGRIALVAKPGPKHSVMLSVSDTGIGMSSEEIETAVQKFGQIDQRLDRNQGGAGLGLSISKAVVEMMGGALVLRSTPGEGTDAVIMLPESGRPPLRPAR